MPLTDIKIRQAKAAGRSLKLADSAGHYLEVRPNGSKLWRYRYRIGGRENLYAIGDYPTVSLAAARKARDESRDPPLLWRRCDGVGLALLVAASVMAWGAGWALAGAVATLLALLHAPVLTVGQWIRRRLLARDVEGAIDSAQRQATVHHGLRRVK